jgi:hypothetical protein
MLVTNVVTIDGGEVRFPPVSGLKEGQEQKAPKVEPQDTLVRLVLMDISLSDDFHLLIP